MSLFTGHQVTLGPLTLSTSAFLMLLGALAGVLLVFFRCRGEQDRRRMFFDHLSTAALLVMLGWKLFPLLDAPGEMIARPMTLLYTPGGTPGLILGLVLGLAYFGYRIFRSQRRQLLRPLAIFSVTFIAVSGLLLGTSSALRAQQAAEPAPTFQATTLQGEPVSLEALKGKTVILNFWATWCPPCRAELPTLVAFGDDIADSDTVLIGIAVGPSQTPGAVGQFMEREKINYPVLLDNSRRIAASYAVRTLPTSVVISPDGTVRETRVGAVDGRWLRSQREAP